MEQLPLPLPLFDTRPKLKTKPRSFAEAMEQFKKDQSTLRNMIK